MLLIQSDHIYNTDSLSDVLIRKSSNARWIYKYSQWIQKADKDCIDFTIAYLIYG
jgi:hypothetical protein